MKKNTIFCLFALFCLVAGCSIEDGKVKFNFEQDSNAGCDCYMTVIWPDGNEVQVDRPYTNEESKANFEEKCGEYIVELSDKGSAVIKCGQGRTPKVAAGEIDWSEFDAAAARRQLEPIANPDTGSEGQAKPKLKMKNPEITGSIDKRLIQKVVRQHTNELRACYERELAKVKDLKGRIVAVWIIAPQGNVTSAVIKETTMNNKNVETCITDSVKYWRFPAPKGGGMAQVEYPFEFDFGGN